MCTEGEGSDPSSQADAQSREASQMPATPSRGFHLTPVLPPQAVPSQTWRAPPLPAPPLPAVPKAPSLPSMPPQFAPDGRMTESRPHIPGYQQYAATPTLYHVFPATNTQFQPAPRIIPMVASALSHACGAPVPGMQPFQQPPAFVPQQVAFYGLNPGCEMAQQLPQDLYSLSSGSEPPSHVPSALPSASSIPPGLEVSVPPTDYTVDTALLAASQRSASMPSLRNIHGFSAPEMAPRPPSQFEYRPPSPTGSDIRRVSNSLRASGAPPFKPYFPTSPPANWIAGQPGSTSLSNTELPGVSPAAISAPRATSTATESWSETSVDSPPSTQMSFKRIRFADHADTGPHAVSSKPARNVDYEYTPTPTPPVPSPPGTSDPFLAPESEEDDDRNVPDDDDRDEDFIPPSQSSPRKRARAAPRLLQPPPKKVCTDNSLVALFEKYPSLPIRFPLFCFALEHNLSFHEPAVPMIKSLSQSLSPLQKCEELKKLWHKGRRILAQLDAFVARCERKVIRPNDEKLPELDEWTRRAIRQVRRKIVERCENYKYTRRDTLNKHVGKNKWEPIEAGMVEWYEGMADNDPANDLGNYRPPASASLTAAPRAHLDRTGTPQASDSSGGRKEASHNVSIEPSAFTPQVPRLPQQFLTHRSASDRSPLFSEHGQSGPRGGYSGSGIGSGVSPDHTPYGDANSGFGFGAHVVPQSGTPPLSANVSPTTPHSPISPSLEANTVPTPNSRMALPSGEPPGASGMAASTTDFDNSTRRSGLISPTTHPRDEAKRSIRSLSSSSTSSRSDSTSIAACNDGFAQDCGRSSSLPDGQPDDTVILERSVVVSPSTRSPFRPEDSTELRTLSMSHAGSGSGTFAPTHHE